MGMGIGNDTHPLMLRNHENPLEGFDSYYVYFAHSMRSKCNCHGRSGIIERVYGSGIDDLCRDERCHFNSYTHLVRHANPVYVSDDRPALAYISKYCLVFVFFFIGIHSQRL